MNNGVEWSYFNKFDDIDKRYLPDRGEGDNMATQIVTAIAKLVYKWYNDGDVYDNTDYLSGWANDLSTYANWLYKYVDGAGDILIRIRKARSDGDYEQILKDLCDNFEDMKVLKEYENQPKIDSIYECAGPFEFREEDEDDWEDNDDEDNWE